MNNPTVVITNKPYPETIEHLAPHCRVVVNTEIAPWGADQLIAHLQGATAMMAFMPDSVDGPMLDRCPDLKFVSCALKGYDNFDLDACSSRGVLVAAVPDLLTIPTGELAVGLAIGLARNVPAGDAYVRGGRFAGWRAHLYGKGLDGSLVGLVGAGAVGRAVAERFAGFGCRLQYFDDRELTADEERRLGLTRTPLVELLASSDFVIVCLPLNPGTRHLIDARAIADMKPGVHVINISRGSVVDEAAIADAIERGHLAGYAADVFELEDWALADRPRAIDPRLLAYGAPTLFTPHLGSGVVRVRKAIEHEAAEHILQFLRGETPSGAINADRVARR